MAPKQPPKNPPNKPQKPLTLLQQLEKRISQKQVDRFSKEAEKWITSQVSSFRGASVGDRIIKDETKNRRNIRGNPKQPINLGQLVFFIYDAKHKDTLKWWDAAPLTLITSIEKDRMNGINFHIVVPKMRAYIFDILMQITTNKKFDDTTKIRLTYGLIKKMSQLKMLRVCYREYLFSHIRSKLVIIQPKDWNLVIYLNIYRFQKASASTIWSEIQTATNQLK